MKHTAFMLILLACLSSYAALGFTVTGGLAEPIGESSNGKNLGLNFGGSLYGMANPTVGLGGEFRLNYWSYDTPSDRINRTLQYYEFLFSPLFFIPLQSNLQIVLQPGIGLFNGVINVSILDESDSDSEADLGVSLQGQLVIQKFVIQPAFKVVFTENESTQWFVFNVGYQNTF